MPSQKEDYLLQLLDVMAEMLRQITRLRVEGRLPEALSMVLAAQEKLFGRPASDFAALAVADQLRILSLNEPAAAARAKRLVYASTLREAGLIYRARSKDDLAVSAFQLALYVTLTVAIEPDASREELKPKIAELMEFVPANQFYPPTTELLQKLARASI